MSTPPSDPNESLVRVEDDFTMMPYSGPTPGPRFPRSTYVMWVFSLLMVVGAVYLLIVGSNSCGAGDQGCQVANSLRLLVGMISLMIACLGALLGVRLASSAQRRSARQEARLQQILHDL